MHWTLRACHATQSACAHTPTNKMTQQKKSAVIASRHFAAQAKQAAQLTNHTKSGAGTCQSNLHQIWSRNGTVNMPQQV